MNIPTPEEKERRRAARMSDEVRVVAAQAKVAAMTDDQVRKFFEEEVKPHAIINFGRSKNRELAIGDMRQLVAYDLVLREATS